MKRERSSKTLSMMKTKLLAFTALAVSASFLRAAPLIETTAVHTKPDEAAPTVSYLKAGTEPQAASNAVADTPAGWMAVELTGPFDGYVQTKDLTKGLDVKPGTPIRLAPDTNSGVLAVAQRGMKTTITGLRGKWTQLSLNQPLTGYIHVGGTASYVPPIANTPASSAIADPSAVAAAPLPNNLPGQPAVASTAADSASLPRQLTGKFVSTRSVLHPRRPYDWALEDNSGKRYAYVDISKLLLTDRIEKYIGHFVVVFGAAKPTADGKDIVIQVESLQLLLR